MSEDPDLKNAHSSLSIAARSLNAKAVQQEKKPYEKKGKSVVQPDRQTETEEEEEVAITTSLEHLGDTVAKQAAAVSEDAKEANALLYSGQEFEMALEGAEKVLTTDATLQNRVKIVTAVIGNMTNVMNKNGALKQQWLESTMDAEGIPHRGIQEELYHFHRLSRWLTKNGKNMQAHPHGMATKVAVGLGLGVAGLGAAAAVWSGSSGKQEAIDGTPEKSLDHETLR